MKNSIPNPCSFRWEQLHTTTQVNQRFCQTCEQNVHDIRGLRDDEIERLFQKNNGKLCVKANKSQLSKTSTHPLFERGNKTLWATLLIVFLSFFNIDISAQNSTKSPNYTIKQKDSKDSIISLKGVVRNFRNRRMKKATIEVYSHEGLLIGQVQTNRLGKFKFSAPAAVLGSTFSIKVHSNHYVSTEVNGVATKDTYFSVILDTLILIGRYF